MEFGKSLRAAREAKGYTVSQIADMTRIKFSIVEGLENDDFSSIVAPIYGRGFVKLYCEAVGLEAKPFVDEFMEIVNGNRDVPIRERTVTPAAEPTMTEPPPPAEPTTPEPPPPAERDLFTQAEAPKAEAPKADISRYASPFRSEDRTPAAFPSIPWRLILLGIAGLVILLALVFGIRALYRATSAKPAPETVVESAPAVKTAPAAQSTAKSAARTQQQNIPSLYID